MAYQNKTFVLLAPCHRPIQTTG